MRLSVRFLSGGFLSSECFSPHIHLPQHHRDTLSHTQRQAKAFKNLPAGPFGLITERLLEDKVCMCELLCTHVSVRLSSPAPQCSLLALAWALSLGGLWSGGTEGPVGDQGRGGGRNWAVPLPWPRSRSLWDKLWARSLTISSSLPVFFPPFSISPSSPPFLNPHFFFLFSPSPPSFAHPLLLLGSFVTVDRSTGGATEKWRG